MCHFSNQDCGPCPLRVFVLASGGPRETTEQESNNGGGRDNGGMTNLKRDPTPNHGVLLTRCLPTAFRSTPESCTVNVRTPFPPYKGLLVRPRLAASETAAHCSRATPLTWPGCEMRTGDWEG